jgi:hypothetical protein
MTVWIIRANLIQDDGEFFIIRSQTLHIRLWIVYCILRDIEFILSDFERMEFSITLEHAVMESSMSKTFQPMAVLVLVLAGMVGYDFESHAAGAANPARVAEMKQTFRDLWLGHIYWVQHAVLNSGANSLEQRAAVKKEVDANTKQIASMLIPFYGEARSQKFLSLLDINIDAVREYSEATTAGDKSQQDAALARLASNANDFGAFFSGINPHLSESTARGLIAAHGAHHVLQINQYKKKDYAHLDETWKMMREHVYVIADTLTEALVKQFPEKFS